jgi:hypothetical protein
VLGTVAATVPPTILGSGPLTRAALGNALTAGYATAFEIASGIAFAGFLIALVTIRRRQVAATPESEGIAA